jgi:hypothetical protein
MLNNPFSTQVLIASLSILSIFFRIHCLSLKFRLVQEVLWLYWKSVTTKRVGPSRRANSLFSPRNLSCFFYVLDFQIPAEVRAMDVSLRVCLYAEPFGAVFSPCAYIAILFICSHKTPAGLFSEG